MYPDGYGRFDLVNPAEWTFEDIVFILQPSEKAGKIAADIIKGRFVNSMFFLILCQASPDIICSHHTGILFRNTQNHSDVLAVQRQCLV